MKPQDVRLGYLLVTSPVNNVFIGGIMVVDGRGLPIEFRYTEPIQPTRIQQVLYGSVLSQYIKTEVILDTLLRSLETKPDILVVSDDGFLLKDISNKDFEVIRLMETKASPLKGIGLLEKISNSEFLLQLTQESSPVRVQLSYDGPEGSVGGPKSLGDSSTQPDVDFTQTHVYQLLSEIGQATDILEPTRRVEKALSMLCQEAGTKTGVS